jgi:hypothetical protein
VNGKHILWGAVLLGTAAGYLWSAVPPRGANTAARMHAIAASEPAAEPAEIALADGGFSVEADDREWSERTTRDPAPAAIDRSSENTVYYPNCNVARAAGAAPMFAGQPGYRSGLDGDGDGIACEPYRAR